MATLEANEASARRDGIARRLTEVCTLLEEAGAGRFEVVPGDDGQTDRTSIVPGWSLGGGEAGHRRAVAEVVRSLLRADQEMRSLASEIVDRYEEATLIYRLCDRLGSVLGESGIARLVLEDAAAVLGARAGEVWLHDPAGLSLLAVFPAVGAARWEQRDSEASETVARRRPLIVEAAVDRESVVAVPLPSPDAAPIGALVMRGRTDDRSYRTGEVKLLTALASLTSAFIRNDRLAEEARRAEARKREDEIARQIHRSLLPRETVRFPGLRVAGTCRAAENIGGDYYGYLSLPDGSLGLAMADVSGHGVGAALYMAAAKGALQAEARRALSPADLLCRTNDALVADFARSDVFATAFFARFYPGGRRIEFSNGGHNSPLLIRADGGIEQLRQTGPALGILHEVHFEEESRRFAEGDLLVVFTDGLVEARSPSRRFYGTERVIEIARAHRDVEPAALVEAILTDLERHCGSLAPQDDVTLVAVRGIAGHTVIDGGGV